MRASVVLPGVSEGVLPPNAEPVTSQEALHHLAKQVSGTTYICTVYMYMYVRIYIVCVHIRTCTYILCTYVRTYVCIENTP